MARYFFHIQDGGEVTRDPDGEPIDTLAAALEEAKAVARDLMAARLRTDRSLGLGRRVIIEDEHSAVLATVAFREALAED